MPALFVLKITKDNEFQECNRTSVSQWYSGDKVFRGLCKAEPLNSPHGDKGDYREVKRAEDITGENRRDHWIQNTHSKHPTFYRLLWLFNQPANTFIFDKIMKPMDILLIHLVTALTAEINRRCSGNFRLIQRLKIFTSTMLTDEVKIIHVPHS